MRKYVFKSYVLIYNWVFLSNVCYMVGGDGNKRNMKVREGNKEKVGSCEGLG